MTRTNLVITALLGALAVILGAFGAHALKTRLDPDSLMSYETGVRYMMFHVVVILLVHSTAALSPKARNSITSLFLLGILFFSGSIFCITLELLPAERIWVVTPLGGMLFVAGWLHLAWSYFRSGKHRK